MHLAFGEKWCILREVVYINLCSCVGIEEHQCTDIDNYHCPNCQPEHGPLTCKDATNLRLADSALPEYKHALACWQDFDKC